MYFNIFLIFFACVPSSAREACGVCDLPEGTQQLREERLACLRETIRTSKNGSPMSRRVIECAIREWRTRDGDIASEISDLFLEAMEHDPTSFFQITAKNEPTLSEWLSDIGILSFTWYQDPPSPLEKKRVHLIQFLEHMKNLKGKEDLARRRILTTLQKIKPRQVD